MLRGFLKKVFNRPFQERRAEPRYQAEDDFLIEFKGIQSHYVGASRDISMHGVRFATTCKLPPKKEIMLNFRFPSAFPGESHVTVPAKVIRVYLPRGASRYRVGCRLKHTNDQTRETFRQFIFWLQTRSKP